MKALGIVVWPGESGRRSMECLRQRRFRLLWRWLDVEKAKVWLLRHLPSVDPRIHVLRLHPPYQQRILL